MKKFLLFFWNAFITVRNHIKDLFFYIKDFFYTRTHKAPDIMSCEETVKYILSSGCSVSRFGDAELKLVSGRNVIYQVATPEIRQRLSDVLGSDDERLLVCLPSVFDSNQLSNRTDSAFWKKHLAYTRKYWYQNLKKDKKYGNAFISRNYMALKDKSSGIAEYFDLIKKIWEGKDIIIVEGEKSRLGMGNDLFSNAKSVSRILGPSTQSYSKYNEILSEIRKHGKDNLILLAMGPTASILPYDLCRLGYQAIDIGNIDTEYEWYLMGATKKTPVKNKMVYEAGAGVGVGEADDPEYLSQIIAKIY